MFLALTSSHVMTYMQISRETLVLRICNRSGERKLDPVSLSAARVAAPSVELHPSARLVQEVQELDQRSKLLCLLVMSLFLSL